MEAADFLLVIPCYCESKRLAKFFFPLIQTLANAPFTTDIMIVDDGSPIWEQRYLEETVISEQTGSVRVLRPELMTENTGKGGAVLHGWRKQGQYQWKAFVDADGAIPPHEVHRVLSGIYSDRKNKLPYFATRCPNMGRKVERTLIRALAGNIFTNLARIILGSDLSDSQCGFKVIPSGIFERIDCYLKGFGFCFDLELYMAIKQTQTPIKTIPIDWKDQPGGHLNVFRNGPGMIMNMMRIRQATRRIPMEVLAPPVIQFALRD